MSYAPALAAAGPNWADKTTAIGTVLVAAAAVLIALLGDWRTTRRIRDEREYSAGVLADERAEAGRRLALQLEHSDRQLQAERDAERAREQLAEASAVEVNAAQMSPEAWGTRLTTEPDTPIACPVAIVINRGRYTITDIHAWYASGTGGTLSYGRREHFSWWSALPGGAPPGVLTAGLTGPVRNLSGAALTPSDAGLRFSDDARAVPQIDGSYPIVRWRDRWGTRWEHRQGIVRQVADSEGVTG